MSFLSQGLGALSQLGSAGRGYLSLLNPASFGRAPGMLDPNKAGLLNATGPQVAPEQVLTGGPQRTLVPNPPAPISAGPAPVAGGPVHGHLGPAGDISFAAGDLQNAPIRPMLTAPADIHMPSFMERMSDRASAALNGAAGSDAGSAVRDIAALPFNVLRAYGAAYGALPGMYRDAAAARHAAALDQAETRRVQDKVLQDPREWLSARMNPTALGEQYASRQGFHTVGGGDTAINGPPGMELYNAPRYGMEGNIGYSTTPDGTTQTGTIEPSYAMNTDRLKAESDAAHNAATERQGDARLQLDRQLGFANVDARNAEVQVARDRLAREGDPTPNRVIGRILDRMSAGDTLSDGDLRIYRDWRSQRIDPNSPFQPDDNSGDMSTPPPAGAPPASAPATPAPQGSAGRAPPIPQAAINYLRANPNLAPQFEQQFHLPAGGARRYLAQ